MMFYTWYASSALLATLVLTTLAADHHDHQRKELKMAQYQDDLIRRTEQFRPKPHEYAGWKGPWLENRFLQSWMHHPHLLKRVYVPIAWTDTGLLAPAWGQPCYTQADLQKLLNELEPSYSYFSVIQMDLGLNYPSLRLHMPRNLDFVLFAAGSSSPPIRSIPVPLLKEEQSPVGLSKTISVAFQGSYFTSQIRTDLHDKFHKRYLFLDTSKDWRVVLESSNFSFCPRGMGTTSFRLYETLQLGTIPIYVWEEEKWLPFSDLIDWDKFAIVIGTHELDELPSRILKADVAEMQQNLADVRHMFTYNYTIQYIRDWLSDEKEKSTF